MEIGAKILVRTVGCVGAQGRSYDKGRVRAEDQGVAVGRSVDHLLSRDPAAGTRTVLCDDTRWQCRRKLVDQHAPEDVAACAWREAENQLDVRIGEIYALGQRQPWECCHR